MGEEVFDRVFHRQDVALAVVRAVVDHRSQRGALAGTGRAHHQQQAAFEQREIAHHRRQAQRLEVGNGRMDQARDHGGFTALSVDADAEAADARGVVRQVGLQLPFEVGDLFGTHDRVGGRAGLG